MLRTFNMGIGLIAVIPADEVQAREGAYSTAPEKSSTSSAAPSRETARSSTPDSGTSTKNQHRLGILLSGRGSNFLAIADSIRRGQASRRRDRCRHLESSRRPGIAAARERGSHRASRRGQRPQARRA